MTLRHLLERGVGTALLLSVLALLFSSRQVDSLYLQDCHWTVNQTLGRDLCVQPDAEFAESGMLADFAYPIYHRQARALSTGHFSRARFLVSRRNGIVTGPSVQELFPPLKCQPLPSTLDLLSICRVPHDRESSCSSRRGRLSRSVEGKKRIECHESAKTPCTGVQEEKTPQKAAVGELERVYNYDILVSESMMEEGLSNLGDTINIRRAVHKLATGKGPADTKHLDSASCRCFSPLNVQQFCSVD